MQQDGIQWMFLRFDELTLGQLYDLLHLRMEVFVVEQRCFYQDLDYDDQKALHLLGYVNDRLVTCSRIFAKGDKYEDAVSFGRVIVDLNFRKRSLGRALVARTLEAIECAYGDVKIRISAQTYLKHFYADFGFEQIGEEYMDAEMPHIPMKKS